MPEDNAGITATAMDSWQQRWDTAVMGNYGTPQVELVRGQGSYVWDANSKRYLDFLSGIAVNALGHGHPAITEAVTTQMHTLGHTSNIFAHPGVIAVAEKLVGLVGEQDPTGRSHGSTVFFCNSGAEANEAAFKIARATGRTKIFAAERGFHGRTMGALALTGQPDKRAPFAPMPAGVEFFPFGDIAAVRDMADEDTAAIFVESIQGETGIIPAPPGFLTQLRELCDELGILLVVDEVQAGMGRTGQWFGFQAEGIVPDVITMAKGLGGGLPIGACLATPRAQLLAKGMHGTTFGGNPVVCAAANAVIDTLRNEKVLDNVQRVGGYIAEALSGNPHVVEVRGRGLMLGVVLRGPLTVDPLDYGLLLNRPAPDVLRIVPPLNLSLAEAEEGVRAIEAMLRDTFGVASAPHHHGDGSNGEMGDHAADSNEPDHS
ncbi:acetylornithine transaminase [Corynebacterium heidelbergense]|uniref:Acetylornithine aminotransferase n=1 Tax=Corynebacterium heidelbergense TaxID=2055947 RepID=A0A364VBP8_9CORY|nr:acetylornithine transaminase [Corynebacterium heidelbergense]WCZ36454.1 Acetylornithine aminotransferase [Corynebacterium heidelbergense]